MLGLNQPQWDFNDLSTWSAEPQLLPEMLADKDAEGKQGLTEDL